MASLIPSFQFSGMPNRMQPQIHLIERVVLLNDRAQGYLQGNAYKYTSAASCMAIS